MFQIPVFLTDTYYIVKDGVNYIFCYNKSYDTIQRFKVFGF